MTNLLEETTQEIALSGHTIADIVFIGSADREYGCSWDEFTKLADIEYDDGYGSAVIAGDLVIVFADGRKMWRSEYDGSEWWDFDVPASKTWEVAPKQIARLVGGMGFSLAYMHSANFEESA